MNARQELDPEFIRAFADHMKIAVPDYMVEMLAAPIPTRAIVMVPPSASMSHASIHGLIGKRADRIIIDDPHFDATPEEIEEAGRKFRERLDQLTCPADAVIIMSRLHDPEPFRAACDVGLYPSLDSDDVPGAKLREDAMHEMKRQMTEPEREDRTPQIDNRHHRRRRAAEARKARS
jgi:hypothetical protein